MKTYQEFLKSIENINLDEILMVTPAVPKTTKKNTSAKKITKPDPSDPDYVVKQREYLKQRQEAVDYERLRSGAEAASERSAAVKKANLQRQQSDADAARTAFRTKGVPFSDAKGSGHIRNGVKHYDS
jgi:type IV secretory pathway VirB10-like protein